MKKLRTNILGAVLLLCMAHASAHAQKIPLNEPDYNKPALFADLPSKMPLQLTETENLFRFDVGAAVSIPVSDKLTIEGRVVSHAVAADKSTESIVVRATNKPGAIFTLTRRDNPDGTAAFIGRIISRNNSDALVIAQEDGQYVLVKKDFYDLVNE